METFLEILEGICKFIFSIVVAIAFVVWFFAAIETLTVTKQNNALIKELCIEQGLDVDSILSVATNDTLNIKVKFEE